MNLMSFLCNAGNESEDKQRTHTIYEETFKDKGWGSYISSLAQKRQHELCQLENSYHSLDINTFILGKRNCTPDQLWSYLSSSMIHSSCTVGLCMLDQCHNSLTLHRSSLRHILCINAKYVPLFYDLQCNERLNILRSSIWHKLHLKVKSKGSEQYSLRLNDFSSCS